MSKDGAVVTQVRVVAHLSQDVGGISENHWSIYLLLGDKGSIRMNMAAEYGDTTGTLVINDFNYQLTSSALQHWDYGMVPDVTVKMVKDLFYYRGCHRYQFSGGGSAVGIGGKVYS
jgi:hypothetical protein